MKFKQLKKIGGDSKMTTWLKTLATQAWGPKFDPTRARGEPTPQSRPLSHMEHVQPHSRMYTYDINKYIWKL